MFPVNVEIISKIIATFRSFVNPRTCLCEYKEFKEHVKSNNYLSDSEILNLFELLDEGCRGYLEFRQFLIGTLILKYYDFSDSNLKYYCELTFITIAGNNETIERNSLLNFFERFNSNGSAIDQVCY